MIDGPGESSDGAARWNVSLDYVLGIMLISRSNQVRDAENPKEIHRLSEEDIRRKTQ